jgi:hypothetical protein
MVLLLGIQFQVVIPWPNFRKLFPVFYKWPDLTDVQVMLTSTVPVTIKNRRFSNTHNYVKPYYGTRSIVHFEALEQTLRLRLVSGSVTDSLSRTVMTSLSKFEVRLSGVRCAAGCCTKSVKSVFRARARTARARCVGVCNLYQER